jgi:hypothetical protein
LLIHSLKHYINNILSYIRCPKPSDIIWGWSINSYAWFHKKNTCTLQCNYSLDTDHYCVLQIIKGPRVLKLHFFFYISRHFRSKHNLHFDGHFGCPKLIFNCISQHFRSKLNFGIYFFKMATGGHFGCPKFIYDKSTTFIFQIHYQKPFSSAKVLPTL